MKVSIDTVGDIQVFALQGSLDGGWENLSLKDKVTDLVHQGKRNFLFDLEAAHFVNSTGIGVLVACLATVRAAGGTLKLCGVGPRIRRSLETTGGGIWKSLDVADNRDAALRSFTR